MTAPRTPTHRRLAGAAAGALSATALVASGFASPAAAVQATQARQVAGAASAPIAAAPGRRFTVRNAAQLRRAVVRANQSKGKDRIRLVGNIVFAKGGSTQGPATRGDLDIFDDLVIEGNGRIINANRVDRIFDINAGNRVVLKGVNLRNGKPAKTESGGVIRSKGTLILRNSSIIRSKVRGEGASGGAIINDAGRLKVVDSELNNNLAVRAGGAIEANAGRTVVRNSTMGNNRAGEAPGNGGALHLTGAGVVKVSGSKVVRNRATSEGGGLWNSAEGLMTIRATTIRANSATGDEATNGGGGVFNDGGTLDVSDSDLSSNSASGTAGSGGGIFNNDGDLTVEESLLTKNDANRAGGAIETLAGQVLVTSTDLTGNATGSAPGNGGGIHVTEAGTVTYTDGSVTDNSATNEGGGFWNSNTGRFTATNITFAGNTSPSGPNSFNDGGGLGLMIVNGEGIPPGVGN